MKAKTRRRAEIEELLLCGYSQQKIADKLNISESTVYRTVKKIRDSSAKWLSDLAEKDIAHIVRETLEGLKSDLMKLTDMLEDHTVKNDIKLQLQIRKEISAVRLEYLKQITNVPMAWSLENFTKKYAPEPIPQPTMNGLGGISGLKSK
ncbi:MAG: helix-turn-helix domain-containing protein [Nitrosarchaeum sp.]|jgi:transposase|uniref:helix-turn-helix domain-containing protein n=1 Tax=Nitrosarchaeum sp. TaxID=2026886 RepID=UPI002DE605B7|nr:helix-turn-helix domain-containing protein [Nitrosarchaeum sp.]